MTLLLGHDYPCRSLTYVGIAVMTIYALARGGGRKPSTP
jgi:hypothetical protein